MRNRSNAKAYILPLLTGILLLGMTGCNNTRTTDSRGTLPRVTTSKDSFAYIDRLNRLAMEKYEQSIDSTFHYIQLATDILQRIDYPKGKADLENNLGVFYDTKGNTSLALRYYNAAHGLYRQLKDTSNIVQTLMNIAMVYVETGNTTKSVASYNRAVDIGQHLKNDSILGLLYYNYLLQYPDHFSKDATNYYFTKIKSIAQKYGDQRVLVALDQLIADRKIDAGDSKEGLSLLSQTIQGALGLNFNYAAMDMMADIGDRFSLIHPDSALQYYTQAYQLAKEKNYNIYIKIFARKLYDFFKAQHNKEEALRYSDTLLELIAQQSILDNASGIDYVDYALKEKELEAARQRSAYNGRLALLTGIICILAIITLILLWYSRKRARKNHKVLRMQYEQAEAAKEALNKLNRNYDKLLKIVAHDLRNPIGVIYTLSTLLKKQDIDPQSEELVSMIHMAADNSKELIGKLLNTDFDRQLILEKTAVNLDELLKISVQLLRYRAAEKDQELLYKGTKNLVVHIDKNKIIRVIDNLVVNAIKFSPEKSSISVTLKKEVNKILISVKDKGIGIPDSIQDKIFNPFTSAKRPGTRGETPFGLGLYMSREIIEAHGGRLYLNTAFRPGAEFIIELTADHQPQ